MEGMSERMRFFALLRMTTARWLRMTVVLSLAFAGISLAETPAELNNKAVQFMDRGDFDSALFYLLKANDLSPTDESIRANIAACYTIIGNKEMGKGNANAAISHFKSAIYYSDDPNIRFYKGYAHYRLKEYDMAVYEIEKAQESGLSSPDLYVLMGRAFYDKGENASAIDSWRRGLELYPENKEIKGLLEKAEREEKVEEGFKRDGTSHFTIQYDAGRDEALADSILVALEEAYYDVNLDLGHFPEGNTIVILYAKKDFKEVTRSPDWSGGIYDGKIRLPVGGIKEVDSRVKAVLYHEYTHVVTGSMTRGKKVPTWLNEGVAEYEGSRSFARKTDELKKAAMEGRLIPIRKLEMGFSGLSDRQSSLAYLQSYSLVKYIIDRFGLHTVREILGNIGRGDDTETSIKKALEAYREDYETMVSGWEKTLK